LIPRPATDTPPPFDIGLKFWILISDVLAKDLLCINAAKFCFICCAMTSIAYPIILYNNISTGMLESHMWGVLYFGIARRIWLNDVNVYTWDLSAKLLVKEAGLASCRKTQGALKDSKNNGTWLRPSENRTSPYRRQG
jgi:hypothetical protein